MFSKGAGMLMRARGSGSLLGSHLPPVTKTAPILLTLLQSGKKHRSSAFSKLVK